MIAKAKRYYVTQLFLITFVVIYLQPACNLRGYLYLLPLLFFFLSLPLQYIFFSMLFNPCLLPATAQLLHSKTSEEPHFLNQADLLFSARACLQNLSPGVRDEMVRRCKDAFFRS